MSTSVPGTQGYEESQAGFIATSRSLDFEVVCQPFLPFLPKPPARVLDIGSGAGQNAAALASLGYAVTALEPIESLVAASRDAYGVSVNWVRGHLPELTCIACDAKFDFILIEGVWHHLYPTERQPAMMRLSELISRHGHLAISLRNGPAGLGSHVFATSSAQTITQAAHVGLAPVLHLENQASLLPNKEDVTWSQLVLSNG